MRRIMAHLFAISMTLKLLIKHRFDVRAAKNEAEQMLIDIRRELWQLKCDPRNADEKTS